MKHSKWLLLLLILVLVAAWFLSGANHYLSLAFLQQQHASLQALIALHPLTAAAGLFLLYLGVTALSLPGAALLTLAAGALFGFWESLLLVSFASSAGATLTFLAARFLFRDSLQRRFSKRLEKFNAGIEKDGAFYLFTLRLIPVAPFFVINLVMALTPLRTRTFYWVSQLGMLAGTAIYVNAGAQLGHINQLSDLMTPTLMTALLLLGLFPWIARAAINHYRARQVYKGYHKPAHFDRNLVVIGAGSAGLVSAYIGATVKAAVTLVEQHKMGGDCLNTGCVPSKALIKSAQIAHLQTRANDLGFTRITPEFDFANIQARIRRVITKVAPHDSSERYTQLGVDCISGRARLVSPWEVAITTATGEQRLTTRNIIIASGAAPFVPPLPGIETLDVLTTDNLWELEQLPERLLVLGGGPIGCELAQSCARLGSNVTQVEMQPRVLAREDDDAAACVAAGLRASGVTLLCGHSARRFACEGDDKVLYTTHAGGERRLVFDAVLVALGRRAHTQQMGLDTLGITTQDKGELAVNERLQTRFPNIYACGDVAGPYQFTHVAAHQAWYATVNALFGRFKRFKVDYRVIPWATFTDPEVARVGLNEQEAHSRGIEVEVTRYDIGDLDRAIADGTDSGFIKVLTQPGRDTILGATLVGAGVSDLIGEFVLAMKYGIGLNKLLGTIHIYPTHSEANRFVAAAWKQQHKPDKLLRWAERLHRWQRH